MASGNDSVAVTTSAIVIDAASATSPIATGTSSAGVLNSPTMVDVVALRPGTRVRMRWCTLAQGDAPGAGAGQGATVAAVGDGTAGDAAQGQQREQPPRLTVREPEVTDLIIDRAGGEVGPPLVEQAYDQRALHDANGGRGERRRRPR